MKLKWAISILLLLAILQTGCKRCRTCKYTYSYAGINETVVLDEICGSKAEVDAYRAQAEEEADRVDGKVTCVDN